MKNSLVFSLGIILFCLLGCAQQPTESTYNCDEECEKNAKEEDIVLQLDLLRNGEIESVSIVKSSGSKEVDKEAIISVKKASPLAVPDDDRAFRKYFKTFNIRLEPGQPIK